MDIVAELSLKIEEWKDIGMSNDDIKTEGAAYLKKLLKESTLVDRKQFFLNSKIDQIFKNE